MANNFDLIEYITLPPTTTQNEKKTYEIADKTWRESPLKDIKIGDIVRWNSKTGNYIEEAKIGVANGVAPLNGNAKIDSSYLSIVNNNGTINTDFLPSSVTEVTPGVGLTTGDGSSSITETGTLKVKLKNENPASQASSISTVQGKQYAVVQDSQGYLSVNVPWEGGSGGGTSFPYNISDATPLGTLGQTSGLYPIGVDSDGYLCIDLSNFSGGGGGSASYSNGNLNIG